MENNETRMMKSKVLYMITKGNFGGAQRYVFDLATHISKDIFDVVVAHGEGEILERRLRDAGIRTIRMGWVKRRVNIFGDIVAFFEIVKILRVERPHVVHLNSSKIGGLGSLAVRILNLYWKLTANSYKLKAIFTGHGWAFNEERNIFSKLLISLLHWFTILLSHTTIAVSEKTKEQIRIFPFTKNKIVCIHNGLVTPNFLGRSEARLQLFTEGSNSLWIGTLSELHKSKGLDYLIEAFRNTKDEFRNTILVIIGEGEERENLESLINAYELTDRVHLVGFKPNASTMLQAFDIGALTSRTEALPYALLEMGLARLPVIASWVGGIPEVIVNGESGILVNSGDVEQITKALIELIKNSDKRKVLGDNLKQKVETEFTLEKMVEKTIQIYSDETMHS
jgi:glycosyltransferase involved in cell wall biosynthesis